MADTGDPNAERGFMTQRRSSARIERLLSRFGQWGIDAFLFFDLNNIRYMTGFSGSDGILLIGPDERPRLLVDGRYVTQAKGETRGLELVRMTDKVETLTSLLADLQARVVGFEEAVLSVQLHRLLKARNRRVKFKPLSSEIDFLRARKSNREIACIRKAADIAAGALQSILPIIKPGICERDIALELEYRMRKEGAEGVSFDTIVASGPNAALPHARPGSRKLAAGDALVIDYGAVYNGYRSDETCTFFIGRVESALKAVYGLVKEAHDRAIEAAVDGRPCKEVDRVAREIISKEGWGDHFGHGTGHGVGLEIHEVPAISVKSERRLEKGMVVTIEPGIYLPGKWGIRIEDTIRVTSGKAEILTKMPKELNVLA